MPHSFPSPSPSAPPGLPPTPSAPALADGLSRDFLLHHRVCPLRLEEDGILVVAAAPGARLRALEEISFAYRRSVVEEPVSADELERLVERITSGGERRVELAQAHGEDWAADVRDLASQPPVVRYVNFLVGEAYRAGASDVHLEADRAGMRALFRVDGVRVPAPEGPPGMQAAVVSRIKLLAEMDIAERRRPQDGRIRVALGPREMDLRVSTVPTLFGESVVLRLLERGSRAVGLSELGMPASVLERVSGLARRPHGMLLVTGPTGSGKTTTLYAALGLRDALGEKIVTVEDPVEYHLEGVTQVPVHAHAGVTFASALRSILRQDPDVVMVGEMRDPETAAIAVQAAMTGHLVLSTLHTNDAVDALPRLLDMGVADYLINATLDAVLAQRLVRRICDACRAPYRPDAEAVARLTAALGVEAPAVFEHGEGCAACRGTGYRGRVGVFELLEMDEALRAALTRRAEPRELRALAGRAGWAPMRGDAWNRVRGGDTTIEEVLRVVQ